MTSGIVVALVYDFDNFQVCALFVSVAEMSASVANRCTMLPDGIEREMKNCTEFSNRIKVTFASVRKLGADILFCF